MPTATSPGQACRFERRRLLLGTGALLGSAVAAPFVRRAAAAPLIRADDPELSQVLDLDAEPRTLFRGAIWAEGPCWVPALGGLVFSDVRANRQWLLREGREPAVFRDPSNNANGNVLDAEGRLVSCEHRGRRVVRHEADGRLTVLADRFDGLPLNAPNDAVLMPDGAIVFSDPVFGIVMPDEGLTAPPRQPARRVYRIDPTGRLDALTDAVDQPNGVAVSPDGRTLYVSEAGANLNPEGPQAIVAFPIEANRLGAKRTFASFADGPPDGLALDADGRLYAAMRDGVHVFAPSGRVLGRIATAKPCANIAFGGENGRRLFLTSADTVQAFDMKVAGIEWKETR